MPRTRHASAPSDAGMDAGIGGILRGDRGVFPTNDQCRERHDPPSLHRLHFRFGASVATT